jgi:DNA-directed RNA polymerase subunit RPC12/RpoP
MKGFIVLIEWDGKQPPNTYYRRMEGLGYKVRGDAELGPLMRRGSGKGVIYQEGAILTAADSTARAIATIATEEGARNVSIGSVDLDEHFSITRQDAQILNRINSVMGKRGPKPPAQMWVISCTECGQANTEETHTPINCPRCGGMLIHARPGSVVAYADPGGDLLDAWARTRFTGAHWEPAAVNGSGVMPPKEYEIYSDGEREAVEKLAASPVMKQLGAMPRELAFQFLDAIFVNRAYRDSEQRLNGRVAVATEFFKRNGNPADFKLTEPQHADLVDAAGAMDVDAVVTWLFQFAGK